MAKEVLYQNKPGAEFVRQLRERLNGRIVELPDGRAQVFYDFVNERQLQDWASSTPPRSPGPASPLVKEYQEVRQI